MQKQSKTINKTIKQPILKRLYFDIEVTPNIVYTWNVGYKLNIGYENIIKERAIICICYKWEHEKQVRSLSWNKGDDKAMINKFYSIIKEADEVIGHNSDNFDIKWFNTRCLLNGIKNMPSIKSIDTLKLARKHFRFNSNRLDYIGQFLKLGKKIDTGGFDLWKKVMNNDIKALHSMINYCNGDVLLLEKVYKQLEGYSKKKTHKGILMGNSSCSCPNCGNENTYSDGNVISAVGTPKKKMVCNSCGNYFTISLTAYLNRSKINK